LAHAGGGGEGVEIEGGGMASEGVGGVAEARLFGFLGRGVSWVFCGAGEGFCEQEVAEGG
jgi:hypothetical protein